jgi:hypothetical protein
MTINFQENNIYLFLEKLVFFCVIIFLNWHSKMIKLSSLHFIAIYGFFILSIKCKYKYLKFKNVQKNI